MKPAKKKPMNKYLKVALYAIAGIAIAIGTSWLLCEGLTDIIFQIGDDLGGK